MRPGSSLRAVFLLVSKLPKSPPIYPVKNKHRFLHSLQLLNCTPENKHLCFLAKAPKGDE